MMIYNPLSQPPTRDVLQQEDDKIGPQWELWFNQLRALQRSMTGYPFTVTTTGVAAGSVATLTVDLSQPLRSDSVIIVRALGKVQGATDRACSKTAAVSAHLSRLGVVGLS